MVALPPFVVDTMAGGGGGGSGSGWMTTAYNIYKKKINKAKAVIVKLNNTNGGLKTAKSKSQMAGNNFGMNYVKSLCMRIFYKYRYRQL